MADVSGDGGVIITKVITEKVTIEETVIIEEKPDTVAPIPVSFSIYDDGVALPVVSENDSRATAAGGGTAIVSGVARYGDRLTGKAYYTNVMSSRQVVISHNPSSFVDEPVQHTTLPIGSGANHASHIEFDIITRKSDAPQGTQTAYVTLTIDTAAGAGIHTSYTIRD